MKKQNPGKFVKKNSKINIWKIKNIIKLEINVLIQEKIDVLRIAYVTYSVFQKVFIVFHKVTRIDKKEEEITNNISYILQFVDGLRFMESPLTYLVNSLFERIHKIKCKYGHNNQKCETCRSKYKYSECFFVYENFKDYLIELELKLKLKLFYCCKNMFVLINIRMIGKTWMKHLYLKKNIFAFTSIWKILMMQFTHM